ALRSAITVWLRARGYITTDTVASQQSDSGEDEAGQLQSEYLAQMQGVLPADRDAAALQEADELGAYPSTASSGLRQQSATATRQPAVSKPRKSQDDSKPEANDSSAAQVLHRQSPYNLLALRDLYTQLPEQTSSLRRFGSELFVTHGTGRKETTLDLPIGPDY